MSEAQLAWHKDAKCKSSEVDTKYFFVDGDEASSGRGPTRTVSTIEDERKEFCKGCAVLNDCLRWAMLNPRLSEFGVFGGTSPDDRKRIRRRAAAKNRRTAAA